MGKVNVSIEDIKAMNGPYVYNKDEVAARVIHPGWNGNYRTGVLNSKGEFVPKYVGRGDVLTRLNDHLDEGFKDSHFKFIYEADEFESYKIESADYDYFGVVHKQLRNKVHPGKPDGMDELVVCPYCGQ